jgi:hypothetical protein
MEKMISLAAVPLSKAKPYLRNWDRHGLGVEVVQRFLAKQKGANKQRLGYRLYLPISDKAQKPVVVPVDIRAAVQAAGYQIENYVLGIASKDNGARKIKIGKLIAKNNVLKTLFDNDKQRSSRKDEYVCVISCHPYDIIGMSTGRRWDQTSCMRIGVEGENNDGTDGAYFGTLEHDITEGTLVAYAISPNDSNIEKPHARFLIRPFKSVDGSGVYFKLAKSAYGNSVPGFEQTLQQWLKVVNRNAKQGFYKMPAELYDDGQDRNHLVQMKVSSFRTPSEVKEFLKNALSFGDDVVKSLILFDKDWLEPILDHYNSAEDAAQYWNTMEIARRAMLKPKFIGQQITYTLGGTLIQQVLSKVLFSTFSDFYIKNSHTFSRWLEDNVQFSEGRSAPPHGLLSIAVLHDVRWVTKIDPTPDFVKNVFQMYINGKGQPVPKAMRKMRSPFADQLNGALCMCVEIANRIGEPSSQHVRETLHRLSNLKYSDDLKFTEEKRELLFASYAYVWLLSHFSKDGVITTLGLADARWIEEIELRPFELGDTTVYKIWDNVMATNSDKLKSLIANWLLSYLSYRSYAPKPALIQKIGAERLDAVLAWSRTYKEWAWDVPRLEQAVADCKTYFGWK